MKRILLIALLGLLALPAVASAHPLGNFTVNRFARVEIANERLYVRYVVDEAEIPTLQRVPIRISGLHVRVDGRPVALRVTKTALAHPRGAAGLRTTRFQAILAGPRVGAVAQIAVDDRNYAERIGWKEIVFGASTKSVSDELRAYPKDMLRSPLSQTEATATVHSGSAAPGLLSGRALAAPDRVADSGFASLVGRRHLSLAVLLGSLALAVFWGAAHALSPGHGKTIVTAYLVGSRGTPWHAALLGLITTVTHTAGVFALGGITLLLSNWIVPDQLYPWLDLSAGLLVVGVGAAVLVGRARHARAHRHGHGHHHHHHSRHDLRGLLAVGVSGGLLPCPSALVVLLAAISLHRVGFGLLLVLAFSLGLAAAITGVGLVAVLAKNAFARFDGRGRLLSVLPAVSAGVIVLAGAAMVVRAVPKI
jgi:nickel/cobalt transporter (NicO) family protein